ncbi:MAG TPA: DUF5654 family protein, partial [Candidatus Nanoarchaeia archaeon]|nr:DUF5654 family protein [Candidatus Nanoarchaeia archaeon]
MKPIQSFSERAQCEVREMRKEVVEKLTTFSTAAFGLVAALAWNSAVQAVFKQYFGSPEGGIFPAVAYALSVTLLAVLITIWIGRIAQRLK